jgi:hypothetical protein
VYVIGSEPVHEPFDTVSCSPSFATPETTGAAVFVGGAGRTTAVGAEFRDAAPAEFVAVTRTTSVEPTSAVTTAYVAPVAPAISTQPAPLESHRSHRYAYDGAVPDQVPDEPVSVSPSRAVPVTVGAVEFTGGAAATTGVAPDVAVLDPAAFEAITATRKVAPTSEPATTYVVPVAPGTSVQAAPVELQRRH